MLIAMIFNINQAHASAWLLEQGRYKYIISVSKVNKTSKSEKKQREEAVLYINDRLAYLYHYKEEVKDNPKLQQKISKQIKRLEQQIVELKSYQDKLFNGIGIEYGITSNQNIGVYFLYKEDKFLGKKNLSNEASIYYKFKLFEDNDFVISAQPKILMNKDIGLKKDFFGEISLLSGTSKKIRFFNIFNQNVFSLGHSINNTKHKKMFYSVSTCEGIKFKNGVMISSFTKYHTRQNYGYIYDSSVYEQIGIAKIINFGSARTKNR
ncbi:MAG TPA: hypothetical protein LFW21_02450 [Rickettsia endosymbiont of Pyrocoelia pectoralis]|nr:hypothetical protein [Rickettsia endosymbiont of Pyrocoelia pectoralis]